MIFTKIHSGLIISAMAVNGMTREHKMHTKLGRYFRYFTPFIPEHYEPPK